MNKKKKIPLEKNIDKGENNKKLLEKKRKI